MLLTLLLSGYIPPSSEAINILLGILVFSLLAGLLVLWWGVRLLRREKPVGWLVLMGAVVLPVLGWQFVASVF
ncbi:MAG: hypothetical protein EOO62_27220 [Hymenobacter sp.]|nr:MAG: hypothetical protein EOO62_27220 [Hymenobacter sp.]